MIDQTNSFGYWLRRRRRALDLTQGDLARRVGCATETIRKIETDMRRPSRQMAERMAVCLAIPPAERAVFLQVARAELAADQLAVTVLPIDTTAGGPDASLPLPATPLPRGTVTFLFTDIEGSTRLWERHPQAMPAALARHDTILHERITTHAGVAFKRVGDAVCAAFGRAPDALAAAVDAQRALQAEPWGLTEPVGVRMALHTGTVEAYGNDYHGLPLSRVARLLAAGYGGQILLSLTTQELVREALPPEVDLRDLGQHRLKDLTRSEHIYQLVVPDLPTDFPPLKTLAAHRTNLPAQPTSLIGREQEVRTLRDLLLRADVRLVTLTGPGGVGKTRLALQGAAELLEDFADGIFFVNLAPVGEPTLVAATIAQTLGVKETGGQPLIECLTASLQERHVLLLLDNFEQVAEAAPLLATLVAEAPRLKLLVTSRAVLHLYGEYEFVVPPLAVPSPRQLPPLENLAHYPAVRLFLARAQAVKPACTLTEENAPTIAAICHRLDGLPLAIELAAAQLKLFSPQALLTRLEHRLTMLTGGARDLPARQQTLRATIAWSHDLLATPEQTLFRRLAVFGGGWTLEAAAAVCNVDGDLPFDMLEGLAALVDQSLLWQVEQLDSEPRFTMLETIREYAMERLIASGEAEWLRRWHAQYYLALAERAEPELRGPQQLIWLDRLEAEHDNLRAALGWLLDVGEAAAGLRLAGSLWRFWHGRGYLSEGRVWLEGVLARASEQTPARAQALYGAGMLALYQSDLARAAQLYEESLVVCRELGDRTGIARALERIGWLTYDHGHYAQALTSFEESLVLFRELDDKHGIATSLHYMGEVIRAQGDYERAKTFFEESLALSRELKDKRGITLPLLSLGDVARFQGDYERARTFFEESLALSRELKDKHMTATSLRNLGAVTHLQGDYERARTFFEESLALFGELGDRYCGAVTMSGFGRMAYNQGDYGRASLLCEESIAVFRELGIGRAIVASSFSTLGYITLSRGDYPRSLALFSESVALAWEEGDREDIARGLAGLARVAGMTGQLERAVRLWGTEHALREAIGAPLSPAEQAEYERALAITRTQLDEAAFAAAWATGRELPLDQAIADALTDKDRSATGATASNRLDPDESTRLGLERSI